MRAATVPLLFALLCLGACSCDGEATVTEGGAADGGAGEGGGGTAGCTDRDGDGFGDGCSGGTDCDDDDPAAFPGAVEACDGADDDCDGVADQGLQGCATCGDCGPGAVEPGQFDPDPTNSDGVSETPEGFLQLDETEVSASFAWIANTEEGSVSKVDTALRREVARYPSTLPYNPAGCGGNGECPSRTAVDGNGDVWVANRAFSHQGTVTKIANVACPDRDGDGLITTSRDANADGRIDPASPEEFPGDRDECVLFTVPVGQGASVPRALALDAGGIEGGTEGSAWVGLFEGRQLVKLRNSDGALLLAVDLPYFDNNPALGRMQPYGAAIDRRGRIWMTTIPPCCGPSQGLAYVDAATGVASDYIAMPTDIVPVEGGGPLQCRGSYGIAVDEQDRVWVGGWDCAAVFRYDPASGQWAAARVPGAAGSLGRGVAVERRTGPAGELLASRVWVAFSSSPSMLASVNADNLGEGQSFVLDGTAEAIGVGLDSDAKLWVVNHSTNNATWFDPAAGRVEGNVPVGAGPYTYSDFTGYARRNFTAPRGSYKKAFTGCAPGEQARWEGLSWDATVPQDTQLDFYLRTSDDLATLPGGQRFGPFTQTASANASPVDLVAAGVPGSAHALVEVVLSSRQQAGTPTLRSFRLSWSCPGLDIE